MEEMVVKKKPKFWNISYVNILLIGAFGLMAVEDALYAQNGSAKSDGSKSAVLLISIDGLKPDYVSKANELGLDIPNLRELWQSGAYATGVKGVLPTSTYPSHTTIITGVSPEKHGVIHNQPFDPYNDSPGRWFWYAEELLVPTLWEAAYENGYKTGSVSWPVTVGLPEIHFNIPEIMATRSSEDVLLTRATSTPPGMMREIEETAGEYRTDHTDPTPRDWSRLRYTLEIIHKKKPGFLTVHLTSPDGLQHANGPYTREAFDGIEEVDKIVGKLWDAFRKHYPNAVICIVSDHGFADVNYGVRLDGAFVREGLITLSAEGNSLLAAGVKDWVAIPYGGGGSSAVVLKDPDDEENRERVRDYLLELASDPANGIATILEREDIAELGGTSKADFWVDFIPGYRKVNSLSGSLVTPISRNGTHGHSPTHPEMDSTFIITGTGIKNGLNLGRIDMRNIAPTIAKVLDISFPSADMPSLEIFEKSEN